MTENEAPKRYELSRDMFDNIRDMNDHEDTKAERILTAMAFFALTTVTAFGVFISSHLSVEIAFWGLHFNLIPVSFAGFVIFVSLGAFIFLEASLSGFEMHYKNKRVTNKNGENKTKKFEPQSLFYFKSISKENLKQWSNYFDSNVNDLLSKAYADHVLETFLISQKTMRKVILYKRGKFCFYVAIIFFILLVLAGCYALG